MPLSKLFKIGAALILMALGVSTAYASGAAAIDLENADGWLTTTTIYGIRYEMIIFGLILVGVAIFYNKTMQVALIGLLALCFYKYEFLTDFSVINRLFGHMGPDGEWIKGSWNTYLNLILMLPGFSILANIFEESKFPSILPRYLPKGTLGAMVMLGFVFVLSTFLDNIAAAMIGCSMAAALYKGKVHIGYVAAICAASNAGGAGSVVGDTTTTLIWIYGGREQHRYTQDIFVPEGGVTVDKKRIVLVGCILLAAILFNYFLEFPALGIWIVILLGSLFVKIKFRVGLTAMNSTIFLVALVFCAELVPIDSVPDASILSTLAIGFVSAVFNNIPLTQLCLIKGGYDWALISYAVGFGGSMIWFGSSAGVAVCDMFPKARSFMNWLLQFVP